MRTLVGLGLLLFGCKEEPTIVITFMPQDLAVRPDLARPLNGAMAGDPCSQDEDCLLVDATCCGCNAGGRKVAIARTRAAAYRKALHCTEAVFCAAMVSADPSCSATAACQKGICSVRPHR